MSRPIGPHLGPFLQHKIVEWLRANPGATQGDLASAAGISQSMLARIKNHASGVGWLSMSGLAEVFGFADVAELDRAAQKWWEVNASVEQLRSVEVARGEQGRLRDRRDWRQRMAEAKRARPEIDDEAFEMAGDCYDSDVYPAPLTARFVGNLAFTIFAERHRPRG